MNPRDAERLAVRIRKEAASKVRVRQGRTNGRMCVHINDLDPKDPSRSSTTIYSEGEWELHPLNRANRPSKRSEALREAQDASEGLLAIDSAPSRVIKAARAAGVDA